jgi:TetR/AcrR family transcriptional repressor of nem operon
MSGMANSILDAAERRIRIGGFGGFSFRDIAAEVGVKSSSVHYHFPTKESLVAAVVRRYATWVSSYMDKAIKAEPDPIKAWRKAFRNTLRTKKMCPCTVLGASALDLPPEVAKEVQAFYEMCIAKMEAQGIKPDQATELLAALTGALVVANALHDLDAYDRATKDLLPAAA